MLFRLLIEKRLSHWQHSTVCPPSILTRNSWTPVACYPTETNCATVIGAQRDRKRLEQGEAVVHDEGQAPVRIDSEKFGRARTGSADLDRQVLVVEPELIRHPERSERAGAGDTVNAQAGQAVSHVCSGA